MGPLLPLVALAAVSALAQETPKGVEIATAAASERIDYLKSVQSLIKVCPGAKKDFSCIGSVDVCGSSYARRAKRSPQWSAAHAAAFGLTECHHAVLLGSEAFNLHSSKENRTYAEAFEVTSIDWAEMDGTPHKDKAVRAIVGGKPSETVTALSDSEINNLLKSTLSSGNSWEEDGADTFFMAYEQNAEYRAGFDAKFQQRFGRPFRHETKAAFVKKLRAYPVGVKFPAAELPDFIYDEAYQNEPATRFTMSVDKLLEGGTMAEGAAAPRDGDRGAGVYGSLAAQYFITASMTKLAEDRVFKAIAWLKVQKPETAKALDRLESDLKSDPEVRMFWQKAFYNGAQGRQATAVRLLLKLAATGSLASKAAYLGGGAALLGGECEVYGNAIVSTSGYRVCAGE